MQGGRFGGWSLYVKDGKPVYTYNWLGLKRYSVASDKKLAPGKATIVFTFAYDGGGAGKGGLWLSQRQWRKGRRSTDRPDAMLHFLAGRGRRRRPQ